MLQQEKPEDFVIATNEQHSVKDFIETAFNIVGINIIWKGSGLNEIGYDSKTNKVLVKIDERYFRPSEVDTLKGNFAKARKALKWKPKSDIKYLIKDMINYELSFILK